MSRQIDFRKLPADVQTEIAELQKPGDDRFFFPTSVSKLYFVPVLAALGWLAYCYTATQQPLWDSWMYYLTCAISMIIFPLALFGLIKLILPMISKLKTGHIFTKDEFITSVGARIERWGLNEVDALRSKNDGNELEVWIGDREIIIKADSQDDAVKLDAAFDAWKASAGEGLGPRLCKPEYGFSIVPRIAALTAALIAALLFGFLLGQVFDRLNRDYDDQQTFASASQLNTIEELESYKTRHPNGRFVADANQKISEQVSKVRDDYLASVAKGADPVAVAALAGIFENAAKRPDRSIYVKVSEVREVDESVVDTLHEKFGLTINGYDVTVPVSGAEFRRNKAFTDIRVILTSSSNRGAIRYVLVDALPEDAPAIDVTLVIRSEESFFRISSLEDGHYRVSNYPGASFIFKLDFKPGEQATPYHFEYFGQPMRLQSGVFDRRDKDNYSFEKLYFGAATDGLDRTLQQTFGFAVGAEQME